MQEIRLIMWYGSKYPMIYKVLYIQTVVGLGISEASTAKLYWVTIHDPYNGMISG